ncbi:hypothetical protein [Nonomuraea typhae]|uniref:SLATT domain-containing protein n=1 Tax=Nonomuraea typhae TaxID=2603600 RepID=A0ABW7YJE2_9ACTN
MPSSVPDIIVISGYVTAIGAAVALLWRGAALLIALIRKINDFLDDWNGEPEREGVPERPGVMKRLSTIEAELQPNHGGSIKDAVKRTDENLYQLRKDFDAYVSSTEK